MNHCSEAIRRNNDALQSKSLQSLVFFNETQVLVNRRTTKRHCGTKKWLYKAESPPKPLLEQTAYKQSHGNSQWISIFVEVGWLYLTANARKLLMVSGRSAKQIVHLLKLKFSARLISEEDFKKRDTDSQISRFGSS